MPHGENFEEKPHDKEADAVARPEVNKENVENIIESFADMDIRENTVLRGQDGTIARVIKLENDSAQGEVVQLAMERNGATRTTKQGLSLDKAKEMMRRGLFEVVNENSENMEGNEKQEVMEKYNEQRNDMLKSHIIDVISNSIDYVPVVGDAKMGIEGAVGTTLSGEELNKKERLAYIVSAAIGGVLSATGAGAPASTLSTGAVKRATIRKEVSESVSKGHFVSGRSVKILEKVGESLPEGNNARFIDKTRQWLVSNPEATAMGERMVDLQIQRGIDKYTSKKEDNLTTAA